MSYMWKPNPVYPSELWCPHCVHHCTKQQWGRSYYSIFTFSSFILVFHCAQSFYSECVGFSVRDKFLRTYASMPVWTTLHPDDDISKLPHTKSHEAEQKAQQKMCHYYSLSKLRPNFHTFAHFVISSNDVIVLTKHCPCSLRGEAR